MKRDGPLRRTGFKPPSPERAEELRDRARLKARAKAAERASRPASDQSGVPAGERPGKARKALKRTVSRKTGVNAEAAGVFHAAVMRKGGCVKCGGSRDLHAHHWFPQRMIRREVKTLRLPRAEEERMVRDLIYAPENADPVCASDHDNHERAAVPLTLDLVPAAAILWTRKHFGEPGVAWLERTYPPVGEQRGTRDGGPNGPVGR